MFLPRKLAYKIPKGSGIVNVHTGNVLGFRFRFIIGFPSVNFTQQQNILNSPTCDKCFRQRFDRCWQLFRHCQSKNVEVRNGDKYGIRFQCTIEVNIGDKTGKQYELRGHQIDGQVDCLQDACLSNSFHLFPIEMANYKSINSFQESYFLQSFTTRENGISQVYILMTRIPEMISLITRIR